MLRTPLRKPRERFPSLTENDSCAVIKATRIDFSDILTNITLNDTVLFAGETFTLDKIIPDRATSGTHNNSEQNTRTAVLEIDQSESFICSVKFDSELMNAVKCYDFKKHLAKQAVINRDSCGTDVVCLHYCSK